MIDPQNRWAQYGEKPDYSGLLTFAGAPYTEDPAELEGFDVAVVGAPMDDLVSDRPGARLAPRAIRGASSPPGPHLEVGVDAFAALRVVDFGDAPVIPADPGPRTPRSRRRSARCSRRASCPTCSAATTRSPSRRCAPARRAHGPVGMVHFDTHTDTGEEVFGVEFSHGTFIRRLVDQGHLDGGRYAQIGLRGYWPGPEEFGWQAEHGITSLFMHDVRDLGIREVVARAIAAVGPGPVYLTVDVDVLDPAFIPGTGTPEPGGMTAVDLLLAVRTVAAELELVGADVVEVIPTGIGTDDYSALVADRVARETLTGIALRRRG